MTTPSSSGNNPAGGDEPEAPAETSAASPQSGSADENFVGRPQRPALAYPPVIVPLDDDAEDYDGDLGGRAALDLDAAPRAASRGSAGGGGRAPLDLSSLIGEFEAQLQQEQRQARGETSAPPGDQTTTRPTPAVPAAQPSSAAADSAEIARLRGELDIAQNNVRRAQADLVNARRKAEQERARAVQDATERVIRQFFPLFDDFERGLITTRESRNYDQLASGVQAILRNTDALFARYGIEPAPTVGQLFDPTLHEAVGVVETSEYPEDTVVEELRKGYTLSGRLLRAAMVRVARHPAGSAGAQTAEAQAAQAPAADETEPPELDE